MPSLFTGTCDIAILGEEIFTKAVNAFQRIKGYSPSSYWICTDSLDIRNFDYAQQAFVRRDNALEQISLTELGGIFGEEHRRGGRNLRVWGDLGSGGLWAQRPIVP